MIKLTIDNKEVEVEAGASILDAARKLNIQIPTMCHHPELDTFTSCMVCVVKNEKTGEILPSCGRRAEEGMQIATTDKEVLEARKTALELILSEHLGDCEAPCTMACPANMDIPKMNRLIATNKTNEALRVVMGKIALPGVLGRICPAPCEAACKRKQIDAPVSICALKRFTADYGSYPTPEIKLSTGKNAAIIGSGPAGLAAAYYLQLEGIQCAVFDQNEKPGGNLRYAINDDILPKDVLDGEIQHIEKTGVEFNFSVTIDQKAFDKLTNEYDVVIIATGTVSDEIKQWGPETTDHGFKINKNTFETSQTGVFAIGNATRQSKQAIRSLAQGNKVVIPIIQYLSGEQITGETKLFNSRIGKLHLEEFKEYLKESISEARIEADPKAGLSKSEAIEEAKRCLHCDCRKLTNCKLRDYADEYNANQSRFKPELRASIVKRFEHAKVVYEPGKCIKCGICVRITEQYKEDFGLTFIGRGFNVKIDVPFTKSIENGLQKIAKETTEACPTGALAWKEN